MSSLDLPWSGVVLIAAIVAGAVTAAVLGQETLAAILGGLVGGILAPQPMKKVSK